MRNYNIVNKSLIVADVAYIGAINPDHYPLAKLCLENGKHVLCEKALCLNYKQAESLVKLARSKNLFFMEAIWSRFFPAYYVLEKEIASGKLGEVKYVEANFGLHRQPNPDKTVYDYYVRNLNALKDIKIL